MATLLWRFPRAERDQAHQIQAKVIADGSHPLCTCTEDATEVIVWDDTPTAADRAQAQVPKA
jgi:hypothetical protein